MRFGLFARDAAFFYQHQRVFDHGVEPHWHLWL
ncbi:Uncharacterised protein [Vibrio cholerae]|nr:Uncharacterised protein [Vibrio cholerae]